MLSSFFSVRPWELVQTNSPVQYAKQAFSGIATPENVLAFLQTPEFKLLATAIVSISIITLALHVWAWIKMLLSKEEVTTFVPNKRIHTPPSQNYIPKALLWQSSRVGFLPEFGLIDHKPEESTPTRVESTPTRGGDLPTKPAA